GTNERSLPAFQRLISFLRGVRSPSICFAQSHGWPSNVVTSDCSSVNNFLRVAIGKAPTTPTEASEPRSSNSPSSSEPIASGPDLCTRYPASTQSAVRSCLILLITRLSG